MGTTGDGLMPYSDRSIWSRADSPQIVQSIDEAIHAQRVHDAIVVDPLSEWAVRHYRDHVVDRIDVNDHSRCRAEDTDDGQSFSRWLANEVRRTAADLRRYERWAASEQHSVLFDWANVEWEDGP